MSYYFGKYITKEEFMKKTKLNEMTIHNAYQSAKNFMKRKKKKRNSPFLSAGRDERVIKFRNLRSLWLN